MDWIAIKPNSPLGADVSRIDGIAKVTGAAQYGADHVAAHAAPLAHAYLATSAIALGRVRSIDDAAARATPGVLDVLTHENVGKDVKPGRALVKKGYMASSYAPLRDDSIHHADQIVAVVIAETFEIARDAALSLAVDHEAETPTATFDGPDAREVKPHALGETEARTGDFGKAFAESDVTVSQ